jgi:hypothetical protein
VALFVKGASREPHWIRVFICSFESRPQEIEVLLDNEPWPQAQSIAKGWHWACPEEYRSLRHFFMAFPGAASVPRAVDGPQADLSSKRLVAIWSRLKRIVRGAR